MVTLPIGLYFASKAYIFEGKRYNTTVFVLEVQCKPFDECVAVTYDLMQPQTAPLIYFKVLSLFPIKELTA